MNKTLFKSIREYKKQSLLAPFLVILEVLMEVLIPLEMAKIIDVGIANGDLGYIVQRGIILVAMAMLALFFGVQAGNMAAVAAAGYAKNLRHDIFYKVQDFSFKNIDHFSTSGLVTRMTTDITNVQMAYMMSIRLLARAPIMILLSWIMTLLINVKIALLFLIVIPLLGGTLMFIAKKAHPHFIRVFDEYDELNNSVQENVNASRVVKAFVHDVRGCTSDRADRWTKHCIWNHGDWRTDKCDRICDSDSDVSEYGDFCICHDHDRRGFHRPYHGGA